MLEVVVCVTKKGEGSFCTHSHFAATGWLHGEAASSLRQSRKKDMAELLNVLYRLLLIVLEAVQLNSQFVSDRVK